MALNRNLADLEPRTKRAAEQGLSILREKGIRYYVNETRREPGVQAAYFQSGRMPLKVTNTVRAMAGLWPLTEAENAKEATWTMDSKHIEGKALDICPADLSGAPMWKAPFAEYEKIAMVMESVGFEWGGRWPGKKQDCPHYQIKDVV